MNVLEVVQQAAALHQQGQLDKAQSLYEKVLKADKNQADAHNLLGAIFVAKKQFKPAEKHLLKATKLAPRFASVHYNLGKCYVDAGQPQKALRPTQKALSLSPGNAETIFLLANIEVQLGNQDKAVPLYRNLLRLLPQHVEGLTNLANALQELKRSEEAIPLYRQALEISPNHQPASLGLATTLGTLDRHDEAIQVLDDAEAICPHAMLSRLRGADYQLLGAINDAKTAFLRAIELDPSLGSAYRGLSQVVKVKEADELALIESGLKYLPDMPDQEKMHMYFAWGNVQDTLGNYVAAISAYDNANALRRQTYQYKHSDDQALFNIIKQSYSHAWCQSLADNCQCSDKLTDNKQLIFILGMPRSGTSLVEQIISSHSLVTGAGELEYIGDNAKSFKGGGRKFHKQFPNMPQEDLQAMAQKYLQKVAQLAPDSPVVTDKMPHNFLYIGVIAALFPSAKIIHCKRNPVANCLSIYKQFFSAKNSHKYAYNQKELALYHNLYEDLMAHWREVLGHRLYEVEYEKLTTNQEQESHLLIEYCGLTWEDACLDFHKTKRKVKTASAFQVRQPMNTKSVNLWKKYGDGLRSLIDGLYIPEEYRDR